jgi:flagellar biosynthesis protein FlhF
MELKTYQAATMAAALAEVKKELGRDAVILHTRNFRRGGWLGIGGRWMWEVTASAQVNVPPRPTQGRYVPAETAAPCAIQEPPPAKSPLPIDGAEPLGRGLDRRMGEIHRMVAALLSRHGGEADTCGELSELQAALRAQDVAEEIVTGLIGRLQMELTGRELAEAALVREKLTSLIAERIPAQRPDQAAQTRRVMALIGPTGVGKTTTIAKLAARFALAEGKKVGLVTVDTYRIAAVDQLRTYAEIIEVPLRTVLSPGELYQAVHTMADKDVILIDTAGRSPNDRMRLNQLRSFLAAAGANEMHLVVSAASNRASAAKAVENFLPLGANRLIITKLDEAETFGTVLNVAVAAGAAVSYVTAGQEVPDDIAPADSRRLAELIMGADTYGS